MVTDGNQTFCGDHFAVYPNTESLCCTPETNIMLYANYTSIKFFLKGLFLTSSSHPHPPYLLWVWSKLHSSAGVLKLKLLLQVLYIFMSEFSSGELAFGTMSVNMFQPLSTIVLAKAQASQSKGKALRCLNMTDDASAEGFA